MKEIFRRHLSQPIDRVIYLINPILRGWVNYFRVGNSSRCFAYVKDWVEKKVRRALFFVLEDWQFVQKSFATELFIVYIFFMLVIYLRHQRNNMPNQAKFDHLTYFETSTVQEYTSKPQGTLDAGRLAQGRTDYWQKLAPAGNVKKKDLILADWWAESWDVFMRSRVKLLLAQLLNEGFKLYVWHNSALKLLDNIDLLDDDHWLSEIKPEFKDVLTAQAMAQLKLPNDKLAILQRVELEGLLGQTPEASKTINALYLAHTSHSIGKIKAVEASQSTTFEKAVLGKILNAIYWKDPEKIKHELQENWQNVELAENYEELELSDNYKIYRNEVGNVCVDVIESDYNEKPKVRKTYELANNPTYLSLDFKALDSDHPASVLEQLLTPELKGLRIDRYPSADSSLEINPENVANLQYLSLSDSCPPETGLTIVKTTKLRNLTLDARNYQPLEEEQIATIVTADGEHFTELNSLSLSYCNSTVFQSLFRSEMPVLNSLTLSNFLFDRPFEVPHLLNKLDSLTMKGECDAQCVELLTQSAPNCNRLDLRELRLSGSFSPGFHLPKVTSLTLGGLNLEDPYACLATESIIKAASALTTLEINGNHLSGYSFMDAVRIPQVESLTLGTSSVISAQTLGPILRGITDLNELTIKSCESYQWDEELSSLLSNIRKIHMYIDTGDWGKVGAIRQVQDIPGLESIELKFQSHQETHVKGIDNLFKSASKLKSLSIDTFRDFDFVHRVSFPDTVESLNILSHHDISVESLKKMLIAMPKLRFLAIDVQEDFSLNEWLQDAELQELLGNIEKVILPYTHHKSDVDSEFDHSLSLTSEKQGASPISLKRDPFKPTSIDADTRLDPNKSFNVNRLFNATSGDSHPPPNYYRLSTFNHVSLSEKPGIQQPFVLENTGDLDLIPCEQLIPVADVFKLEKEVTRGGHFGKQQFRLDSTWQPIASLSPLDHISHFYISGNDQDYEIKYSKRDNLYYIRSKTGAQTVTMDFLVKSPKGQTPVIINPDIQKWINTFRAFGAGELKLTSKNPTSQECLDALIEQKVGSCRHRSVAFKALMAQKYPDLPIRIVENDCHMFVEIMVGAQWVHCDLGGYPAKLNNHEMKPYQDDKPTKSKITHTEMRYVSKHQQEFERHFETWAIGRDPRADNAQFYIKGILNGQHKKQLIHIPADDIAALNIAIQTQAIHTSHPVFYIHSPDELVCSAPFVNREGNQGKLFRNPDGGGPLHDFLTASRDNTTNSPILIVNYGRFSAADIVRFNGLLDETRLADGTPLPKDAVVIGLIDRDKPNAYNGADFYSRFDIVERHSNQGALLKFKTHLLIARLIFFGNKHDYDNLSNMPGLHSRFLTACNVLVVRGMTGRTLKIVFLGLTPHHQMHSS